MSTGVTYSRIYPNTAWKSPGRADILLDTRDPRVFPFHSDGIWNIGIGSGATFEANTSGTATFQFTQKGNTAGWAVNSLTWSVSVGRAKSTDPVRLVTCDTTTDTWNLRIPDSLNATGGSDGWVTIIDETGLTAREFYAAVKYTDGHWSTRYPLVVTDLRGHGVTAGRRASATPQLGGLILADQLVNMSATHMVSMGIPPAILKATPTSVDGDNIGANSSGGGYVWPAHNADNQANVPYDPAGLTAMGAIYAIPSTVNLATIGLTSAEGAWLGRCLQNNGAAAVAASSTIALAVEPSANQAAVKRMGTDWKILGPYLRRLSNHKAGSVDPSTREPINPDLTLGGGVRRVTRLPDVS